jgi:hypothetical protein
MEMSEVEAEELSPGDRVAEIELVRADDEGLGPDPEELAFEGVLELGGAVFGLEDFVQGGLEKVTVVRPVERGFLGAVRDPEVMEAGAFELPIFLAPRTWSIQKRRTDLSGELRVKPEAAKGWPKQVELKSSWAEFSLAHSTQPRKWSGSKASRSGGAGPNSP